MEKATFGAGCFWGVEAAFRQIKGVRATAVGYAGGATQNPTYEQVCTDRTGHAEVVQVDFDPAEVSYAELLETFWGNHDPTQLNRQGPDVGSQYRSMIFFADAAQKRAAEAAIASLERSEAFQRRIVTQVVPLDRFYMAEAYHQNYVALHPNEPYVRFNDLPKVDDLKAEFPERFRDLSASR